MCLTRKLTFKEWITYKILKKVPKPLIAEEDIICYKVLRRKDDTVFLSWFYNYPYEIREGIDTVLEVTPYVNGVQCVSRLRDSQGRKVNLLEVNGGYIHTYSKRDLDVIIDSREMHFNCGSQLSGSTHLFECIIPKGAEYYKGDISWSEYETYASKCLVIKKEVIVK